MSVKETITPELAAEGREALQTVLARSATDLEFRAKLLENPHAALAGEYGRYFPESLNIKFVEPKGDVTFVLPHPVGPAGELSEREMEAVAGGSAWMCVYASIMGTIAVANGIKNLGDDNAWLS